MRGTAPSPAPVGSLRTAGPGQGEPQNFLSRREEAQTEHPGPSPPVKSYLPLLLPPPPRLGLLASGQRLPKAGGYRLRGAFASFRSGPPPPRPVPNQAKESVRKKKNRWEGGGKTDSSGHLPLQAFLVGSSHSPPSAPRRLLPAPPSKKPPPALLFNAGSSARRPPLAGGCPEHRPLLAGGSSRDRPQGAGDSRWISGQQCDAEEEVAQVKSSCLPRGV